MDIVVSGTIHDKPDNGTVWYLAASPPDYRASFTGSAQPFASPQQAFENTPNAGQLNVGGDGRYSVPLLYPNSYYVDLGNTLVPPTMYMMYTRNGVEVKKSIRVGNGMPYRSLDHPHARDNNPNFYAAPGAMQVRSQERILRDSGYPVINQEAADFWGGKPPL